MWVVPLLSLPGNDHVLGFKSIWLKVIIHRPAIYQFNITLDFCNVIHIRKWFVLFVVLCTNRLSELLQAYYTLCGAQSGLSERQ